MAKKPKPYLRYIGDGSWIPGVPARDLFFDEVKQYALDGLLTSGLYEEIKKEPVSKPAEQEEQWQKESENLEA